MRPAWTSLADAAPSMPRASGPVVRQEIPRLTSRFLAGWAPCPVAPSDRRRWWPMRDGVLPCDAVASESLVAYRVRPEELVVSLRTRKSSLRLSPLWYTPTWHRHVQSRWPQGEESMGRGQAPHRSRRPSVAGTSALAPSFRDGSSAGHRTRFPVAKPASLSTAACPRWLWIDRSALCLPLLAPRLCPEEAHEWAWCQRTDPPEPRNSRPDDLRSGVSGIRNGKLRELPNRCPEGDLNPHAR